MSDSKQMIAVGNWIKAKVLKYEILLLLVIVIVLTLKYLQVPFSDVISTISLSSIAIIYALSALSIAEESDLTAYDLFIYKLIGFCSAVSLIAILFMIQRWAGDLKMFLVSVPILVISFVYILIQNNKRPDLKLFNKGITIRVFMLIFISAGLMYEMMKS